MRFFNQSQDYLDENLDLHTHLVKRPTATEFVFASSNALQGAGINKGALLVVDHSLSPNNGDIVIAIVQGEFMMRLFSMEQGRALLSNTQDDTRVEMLEGDEVWGVVTSAINFFRR